MNLTNITFERNGLASNIVRNLVGERILDLVESDNNSGEGGGLLGNIIDFTKKLAGFAIQTIFTIVTWSFAEIWEFLVEAYFEISYFDWNQTDANLKGELEQSNNLIVNSLGKLAGTGLVWLTGIAVATGLSFKFPVISGRLALELSKEGGQEIRSSLQNLIITSRNVAVKNILIGTLLTARKYKVANNQPINEPKKPWIFAERVDEKINRISNSGLRAFARGFAEGFEDSIIEMGYVIAYTLDDYYAATSQATANILGEERTVVVTPDIRIENEQISLQAPQELIIPSVQNALNNHQFIYNRDVGQIAGMPEEDYISPAPQRRKLKIIFYSAAKPPWRNADGTRVKKIECSIPDVKTGLSWSRLKTGIPRFTWGKYRVTAYFNNGRQMTVYGASYSEAKSQILKLVELSTLEITNMTQGEPLTHIPTRAKTPTLVYPVYAKLIQGDVTISGQWRSNKRTSLRINLWVDEEPENLAEIL